MLSWTEDLLWKAGVVFLMMLGVGALSVLARRRNYERFQRQHTRRRVRVPEARDASNRDGAREE